jgi:hypothetical protein
VLLYSAIPNVRQIATSGKKKMDDPCQGDTVATVEAGAATDAAGAEGVTTAEADRGVKASDGAEGVDGAGGVDGVEAIKGVADFEAMSGVAGFDAMRGVEGVECIAGVECIEGVEGAGAVPADLAKEDFPGIGPAQDTVSQQKASANMVAKADLDMCFPFDMTAGFRFHSETPPDSQRIRPLAPGSHQRLMQ